MNRINYQKIMEDIISEVSCLDQPKKLLLHVCCAPCSSYCLETLSDVFEITVLYYNPNIFPKEEYEYRISELEKLISLQPAKHKVTVMPTDYTPNDFYEAIKGFENEKEGGERCTRCYRLRLEETAKIAKENGFDYFTTSLSISPMKDAVRLNEIGRELSDKYGVNYLYSEFKKKNGYKRSCELSKEYGLYRQDYCGCIYSAKEREEQITKKSVL